MSFETDEYERGQRDGANSSTLGELGIALNITASRHYVLGFRNGAENKTRSAWASAPTSESSGDEAWPIAIIQLSFALFIGAIYFLVRVAFFVLTLLFVVIRWIVGRPSRIAVVLILAAAAAIAILQPYWIQYLNLSVAPVPLPVLRAPIEAPRPYHPAVEQPALPIPTFVPLGHFSDGTYEIELYRDNESGGQIIGLIISFSPDGTKITVGEILDVVGTGSDGPLSFRTTWVDYMPYFRGSLKGDEIEGDYDTTFETEPQHIILQRVENPTTTGVYANREEWSKHLAELLACCGPRTSPDETTDQ